MALLVEPSTEKTVAPGRGPASLADRLVKRFLVREEPSPDTTPVMSFLPRPTQLSLPLGEEDHDESGLALPSLFRGARRIGTVLSYEQPSLDQIIPDTTTPAGAPLDRLMLPGSLGLVLYDGPRDSLAFDWMHWGEMVDRGPATGGPRIEATLGLATLLKGGRATRKLAKHRCIIPLVRYSTPVRDGDVWAHRWITPASGQVACAAGIWIAERGEHPRFALVTSEDHAGHGAEPGAPILLAESALLTWLRAPLRDALVQLERALRV